MKEFVRYDWKLVETLWLNGCAIDNKGWRKFVDFAALFSNLKAIILCKHYKYADDNYIQRI